MTWPETTPTYGTYQWLALSLGMYLNYGPNSGVWDEEQERRIDWIIQRGIFTFYNPQMVEGQTEPHVWSFLMETGTQATTAADFAYDLPTTFGGCLYDVTHQDGDALRRLQIVSQHALRAMQAKSQASGAPLHVAIRPKTTALTAEQLYEMLLYPTPDATVYNLDYRYKNNHAPLSTTNLYPLGTRSHSETILQSCLAIAEQFETKQIGPEQQRYVARLTASIQMDMLAKQPEDRNLGTPNLAKSR